MTNEPQETLDHFPNFGPAEGLSEAFTWLHLLKSRVFDTTAGRSLEACGDGQLRSVFWIDIRGFTVLPLRRFRLGAVEECWKDSPTSPEGPWEWIVGFGDKVERWLKMEFLSMQFVHEGSTEMQPRAICRLVGLCLVVAILFGTCDRAAAFVPQSSSDEAATSKEIDLSPAAAEDSGPTQVDYSLRISGTLKTPAKDGEAPWDLASTAAFKFDQKRSVSDRNGSHSLRAARRFQVAETNSTIGKDHKNQISLPEQSRLIYLYGGELSLIQLSPDVRLTREQLDLLQFPCDPLVALGLLPGRKLSSETEKWNAASWVVPMLTGVDAPIRQEAICSLVSIDAMTAVIEFRCSCAGAVTGSSTEVELTGQMTFDRSQREIRDLKATLKEKRKAGTVSPGLDVVAEIAWTQTAAKPDVTLPSAIPTTEPDARQLLLTLVTPWRILMLHDRSWYIFHETNDLVMLRMLHNGALVAQCNISSAPLLAPGSFTPEDKFLQEVEKSVTARGGVITGSDVIPDRNGWRIQRVRARGEANQKELLWDYYLCVATNGEQISLVFSHAAEDAKVFDGKADQFLNSLTTRPSRPKIALPR